jgi:hypothetical protein
VYDAAKFLCVSFLIGVIAYGLSRALYAQFCTTLSIPFRNIDDLKIYDSSARRVFDRKQLILCFSLSFSGAWALCSRDDPQYVHLFIFVTM